MTEKGPRWHLAVSAFFLALSFYVFKNYVDF